LELNALGILSVRIDKNPKERGSTKVGPYLEIEVSADMCGHDLTTPATGIYCIRLNLIVIPSRSVVMYYKEEILYSLGSSRIVVLFTELECPLPCSPKLFIRRPLLMPIPHNIFFSLRLGDVLPSQI
jgi:hypothetical protein